MHSAASERCGKWWRAAEDRGMHRALHCSRGPQALQGKMRDEQGLSGPLRGEVGRSTSPTCLSAPSAPGPPRHGACKSYAVLRARAAPGLRRASFTAVRSASAVAGLRRRRAAFALAGGRGKPRGARLNITACCVLACARRRPAHAHGNALRGASAPARAARNRRLCLAPRPPAARSVR